MNGICLCIDRLHAGFVGAYGSTWVETPALDRLAADGFVFDQFHTDSLKIESLYRSGWFGRHALEPPELSPPDATPLAAILGEQGIRTVLATDDPAVASLPGADAFTQRSLLPEPRKIEPASSIEAAHLGKVFAEIIQKLESLDGPFFLWCHLSSLGRVWDAPWEMRSRYAEADDPDPPTEAEVPSRPLAENEDPDLLLGISQAYAGQVSLLDLCVRILDDALADAGLANETATVLLGLRGLSLGEHGHVGPIDDRLDGELVHVPLMVRLPGLAAASGRCQSLVQPTDLYPTWTSLLTDTTAPSRLAAADLMPWIRDELPPWRDRIGLAAADGRRGLRTAGWFLSADSPPRLFAKPDDRWEVNDVADRHGDVADQLSTVLDEYVRQLPTAAMGDLPPLDDILRFGLQ